MPLQDNSHKGVIEERPTRDFFPRQILCFLMIGGVATDRFECNISFAV